MISRIPFWSPLWLVDRCTLGCEPTTILMVTSLALSAAGTVASLEGQRQAANSQADYQTQLAAANVENARVQSEQVRDQQSQTNEASQRESAQASLASRKAASTAQVAAGESGVTGNSVDALLGDFKMQEGLYKESLLRQKQLTDVGAGQQLNAIRSGADAQNLSMNAPIAQPNYLAAALQFGAQATGTFAARGAKPKTTTGKTG
jgi:hypothetical protein